MMQDVQYRPDLLATPELAQAPATAPELQDSSINFAVITQILRAHLRSILATGLLCMLLALTVAFVLRPRYTASSSFIPPSSNMSGASALAGQLAQLSGLGSGSLLGGKSGGDLYVGILKSHTIMDRIIDHFNLRQVYGEKRLSDAEKRLAANSDFNVGTKDSIVTISCTDHDPARARDLANAYLQQLQDTNGHLALTENSQRRLFFESRLAQEKTALAEAEVALKQNQERTGLFAPAGQTSTQIQAAAQLRAQIAQRRVQLASLLHDETAENPDVLRIRSEISSLEQQVSQMENGRGRDALGSISAAQVPGLALDYVRLARDVKYHETLFDIIARQYEAARLDEAHDTPLQILDLAGTPDKMSGPPRLLITLGGTLLGLFASCLYFVFRDRHSLGMSGSA